MQVTPPDEQGFCSYGLSVDYTQAAAESAKVVIAQMNTKLPHTGGSRIHLDALTGSSNTIRLSSSCRHRSSVRSSAGSANTLHPHSRWSYTPNGDRRDP